MPSQPPLAANAELYALFDVAANAGVDPRNITCGSGKRLAWRCQAGHRWYAPPNNVSSSLRRGRTGCPACAQVSPANRLDLCCPEAAALLDVDHNAGLTGAEVAHRSNRVVAWRCPVADDHRWTATVASVVRSLRAGNTGCPACAGKHASSTNRLDRDCPGAAALLDPDAGVGAEELTVGTKRRMAWHCPDVYEHRWVAAVSSVVRAVRAGHSGCPACASRVVDVTTRLDVRFPAAVDLFDVERNDGLTAVDVTHRSNRIVAWRCPVADDHRWIAAVASVVCALDAGSSGCPACAGRQVSTTNRLDLLYPQAAALLDPDANERAAAELTPRSNRTVSWRCPVADDHQWTAPVSNVVRAVISGTTGCPACNGKQASTPNRLDLHCPDAAAMLDADVNQPTAAELTAGSARVVAWRCPVDPTHRWRRSVSNMTAAVADGRSGCPRCHPTRSAVEIRLACELAAVIGGIDAAGTHRAAGVRGDVDVLLEGARLVVEYDGAWWHRNRVERDRRKTEQLTAAGYTVVRVREAPLEPIGPHDVVVAAGTADHDLAAATLDAICAARPDIVEATTAQRYRHNGQLMGAEMAREVLALPAAC